MKQLLCGASLALCLTACSTSGYAPLAPGSDTPSLSLASAGVYKGTLSTHLDATLLMLYDGTAYLFYAPAGESGTSGTSGTSGVVVAHRGQQAANGQFTSTQAIDYGLRPARTAPVSMSVDFSRAPAVSGAIAGGEAFTFDVTPDQMLGQAPALATIAGLYNGQASSLGGTTRAHITVTSDGALAGTTAIGCVFKGSTAPHAGLNAYDVSLTFGPAPCPAPGALVTGNAVLDAAHLLAALPTRDGADVFVFDGRK
jgi:hypothetical protein